MPIEPIVQISPDRRTVAVTCTVAAGRLTTYYEYAKPVNDDQIAECVARGQAAAAELEPGAASHHRTTRRVPLGTLYLAVSSGPPMWWHPVIEIGRWRLLVGWLRWSVAVRWAMETDEAPQRRNTNTDQAGAQDAGEHQGGTSA